jgi:hypothetical protein
MTIRPPPTCIWSKVSLGDESEVCCRSGKDALSACSAMSRVPGHLVPTKRSGTFLLSELRTRLHELDHPVHMKMTEIHVRARHIAPRTLLYSPSHQRFHMNRIHIARRHLGQIDQTQSALTLNPRFRTIKPDA